MALNKIGGKAVDVRVVLLFSPSPTITQIVEDILRDKYKIGADYYKKLKSAKDIREADKLNNINPFDALKWMFIVENDNLISKALLKSMKATTSAVYVIHFQNYGKYLRTLDNMQGHRGVFPLLLGYPSKEDLRFIHNRVVKEGARLDSPLLNYAISGYSHDVEILIRLFDALNDGIVLKDRKSIVEFCGRRFNTPANFLMKLLSDLPDTSRGRKMRLTSCLKDYEELTSKYESSHLFFLIKNQLKAVIDLKGLRMQAKFTNTLKSLNLDDFENSNYLIQMSRNMRDIKEISLWSIMNMMNILDKIGIWQTDAEFYQFIYVLFRSKELNKR